MSSKCTRKLNGIISYDSEIPTSGLLSTEMYMHDSQKTGAGMFTVALFTSSPNWTLPKSPQKCNG